MSSNYNELEQRIENLESKIAFQDHTIMELNDVVAAQHKELALFKRHLQQFKQQLESTAPTNISNADETPPHY